MPNQTHIAERPYDLIEMAGVMNIYSDYCPPVFFGEWKNANRIL
jgi:hypothetical protein